MHIRPYITRILNKFREVDFFPHLRNEKFRDTILQAIPFWFASVLAGVAAFGYAWIFHLAEDIGAYILAWNKWSLLVITPAAAMLARWVVRRFAPYATASGIPQVIATVELANPKTGGLVHYVLSLRVIVIKVISSFINAIGSMVVGREGPTIQISASIFFYINSVLPNWWPRISKRNIIVAGAASGLAAAFNTPLGGIVFAIEELTKTHINYFKSALFTAVILAGLTATGLSGPYLYLGYPDLSNLVWTVFIGIVVVACLSGVIGALMSNLIMFFRFRVMGSWWRSLIASFIIAAMAIAIGADAVGSGKHLMTELLFEAEKDVAWYLPFLRIIGPVVAFCIGGAGGVFAPVLAAGATIGALLGDLMRLSDSNINLLILSGMVALLTGITRSPFTSALIVLEMTDRHKVIFHLMLAGLLANIAANLIDKRSMYDRLKHKHLHNLLHEHESVEERKDEEEGQVERKEACDAPGTSGSQPGRPPERTQGKEET